MTHSEMRAKLLELSEWHTAPNTKGLDTYGMRIWHDMQVALLRQVAEMKEPDEEPYAYLVENDQGYFVAAYKSREMAQYISDRGQSSHNQKVVPVWAARPKEKEE